MNAKAARAIKTVFYALDVVNQGMQEKQSITVRCMDIEDLEKQAEAIRVEQIKLYELYADGVLLRDAYIEKKKALSEKLAALQDSIRTEKKEQECADELDEEIRALTKQASEKTYIGGLTNAEYAKHDRAEFVRVVQEAQSSQQTAEVRKQRTRLTTAKQRVSELEVLLCKIYEDNILGKLSDSRYATLDAQYEKEQSELTAEISALEKAIRSYEKHEKDADRFIALIDKYENFEQSRTSSSETLCFAVARRIRCFLTSAVCWLDCASCTTRTNSARSCFAYSAMALSISETRDSTTSSLIRCWVLQSFPTGTLLYWEQVY